jgi:hypothetical protein
MARTIAVAGYWWIILLPARIWLLLRRTSRLRKLLEEGIRKTHPPVMGEFFAGRPRQSAEALPRCLTRGTDCAKLAATADREIASWRVSGLTYRARVFQPANGSVVSQAHSALARATQDETSIVSRKLRTKDSCSARLSTNRCSPLTCEGTSASASFGTSAFNAYRMSDVTCNSVKRASSADRMFPQQTPRGARPPTCRQSWK